MSKDNVIAFISQLEEKGPCVKLAVQDPDPKDIILHANHLGFSFTEEDLKSVLNTRICNAEGLPRPWGWVLARKFGLVRS